MGDNIEMSFGDFIHGLKNAYGAYGIEVVLDADTEKSYKKDNSYDPDKEIFDKEFDNQLFREAFVKAVATVMTISTTKGIDLDKVFDMFVEKMREELHSDDTKNSMKLGKALWGLFGSLDEMGD